MRIEDYINGKLIKFSKTIKFKETFKVLCYKDIDDDRYFISNIGRIYDKYENEFVSYVKVSDGRIGSILYDYNNKPNRYQIHILIAHHFLPKTPNDFKNDRCKVKILDNKSFGVTVDDLLWVNDTDIYIRNCYDYTLDIESAIIKAIRHNYSNDEINRLLPVYKYAKNVDKYINKIRESIT